MSSTRKFGRGDEKNYSNEEKLALGGLVEKYKKEYDEEVNAPPAINIWKIFQPPYCFTPFPPTHLLVFGRFSNPPSISNHI